MTLNFPPKPPLDDVFDPGNGIKYQWDGSQWNQLERTLKTIYPIDLDRTGATVITVQRDLTTLSGNKDFKYIFVCATPILSTELASYTGTSNSVQIQWSANQSQEGMVFVHNSIHKGEWPYPSGTPMLYVTDSTGNVMTVQVLSTSNVSGYHWKYNTDPNILDHLVGTNVSISLCDPSVGPTADDEVDSTLDEKISPYSIDHFNFKDTTIGINDLKNSDEIHVTEKSTGLVNTYSIDNVTTNGGIVRVDVTFKNINTNEDVYDDGKVFNFSYNAKLPTSDEYTHFIDLTTINKI